MRQSVLLLLLACKRDLEWLGREVRAIGREIRRPMKPTLHSHRQVAFVIQTNETSTQLMERLRPVLDVDGIENYWCFTPGSDIASKNGVLDSLAGYVKKAFANVRQWNETEHMRKAKGWKPRIKRPIQNFESGATIKVNFRPRMKRKQPRDPNRP